MLVIDLHHSVTLWSQSLAVILMAEAIWLELGATETLADSAAMKMEKSQCLQTDLMDSPWFWERTLYHTRVSAGREAFQQWNISRPVLAVLPCTSPEHYYYLVYLWLSFIPSMPLAPWKANNYNTLKVLYKHRALKNESYLFVLQLLSIQLFLPKRHLV